MVHNKFGTPFVSNQLDNCPNGGYIDICGNCTTDADYPGTAVCGGCTDDATPACNYDEEAIWDDGSCFYTYDNNTSYCNCADDSQPDPGFDCDGNCITFIDCFGECGGTAVEDCSGECDGDAVVCQTEGACNIGVCAPCSFPPAYRDCNGNCINDVDMDGICDEDDECVGEYDECGECNGTGILDDCGVCDGTGYDECGTCDGSLVDLGCGCGNPAPAEGFDCDGNCLTALDCNGICGGASFINDCGWCEDPDASYGNEGFVGMFSPEFWTEYYGSGNGTITFNDDGTLYLEGSNDSGNGWGGGTDHFGGYAKSNKVLSEFIESFNGQHKFNIEQVYTGKAMFAMHNFLKGVTGNKKALFVHTGGLYHL